MPTTTSGHRLYGWKARAVRIPAAAASPRRAPGDRRPLLDVAGASSARVVTPRERTPRRVASAHVASPPPARHGIAVLPCLLRRSPAVRGRWDHAGERGPRAARE